LYTLFDNDYFFPAALIMRWSLFYIYTSQHHYLINFRR